MKLLSANIRMLFGQVISSFFGRCQTFSGKRWHSPLPLK